MNIPRIRDLCLQLLAEIDGPVPAAAKAHDIPDPLPGDPSFSAYMTRIAAGLAQTPPSFRAANEAVANECGRLGISENAFDLNRDLWPAAVEHYWFPAPSTYRPAKDDPADVTLARWIALGRPDRTADGELVDVRGIPLSWSPDPQQWVGDPSTPTPGGRGEAPAPAAPEPDPVVSDI